MPKNIREQKKLLMKEILTNNNLQNFMIHYLAEKIYAEANNRI